MEIYNNILNFNVLSSTNEYAKELLINENLSEFSVIRALNQIAGKGQVGNKWSSESGKNLTCSIILYPSKIKADEQFIISQIISVSIHNVLSNYCKNVCIKWPNDIYIQNKKIAGILIENTLIEDRISHSIIGIGLNINQKKFEDWIPNPTSIIIETGNENSIDHILLEILKEFENEYKMALHDANSIQKRYLSLLYKYNQKSNFKDSNGIFEGTIIHVESSGKIWIQDELNTTRTYFFKEVEFL